MSSNLTLSASLPPLSPADAAWLAGYIDGDGCICLERKAGSKYRSVRMNIDSADIELLDHVVALVGGTIKKKTKYAEHHRQCWSWRLVGMANIRLVLRQIGPYLRGDFKRERARLVVEDWADCTPRNGHYTPEITLRKEAFEDRFLAIGAGRGKRAIAATYERSAT